MQYYNFAYIFFPYYLLLITFYKQLQVSNILMHYQNKKYSKFTYYIHYTVCIYREFLSNWHIGREQIGQNAY